MEKGGEKHKIFLKNSFMYKDSFKTLRSHELKIRKIKKCKM